MSENAHTRDKRPGGLAKVLSTWLFSLVKSVGPERALALYSPGSKPVSPQGRPLNVLGQSHEQEDTKSLAPAPTNLWPQRPVDSVQAQAPTLLIWVVG